MKPRLSAFLSSHLLDRTERHRTRVLNAFRELQSFDRQDEATREASVSALLADVLTDALMRVPHYRNLVSAPGKIDAQSSLNVLKLLPVLNRKMIQDGGARLRAENATALHEDATGGSTGTPMKFWVDRDTQIAREASLMWADSLAGWEPGEKIAMLWGSDRDVSASLKNWRLTMRWWIENRRWFNAFDLSEDGMRAIHASLVQFSPRLLVAYAGTLFDYARFLRRERLSPSYPSGAIISSAEMLSPEMRALAESVFSRRVFDRYGNREFGAIATECEAHDGLHINERDCIVEIESPDPERTPGRLIVTYLRNRAMPFLRYDTGDLACFAPRAACRCGRSTRRLTRIEGRVSDMIRTPSGRLIHGEYFTHLMYQSEGVREFQFVQETLLHYRLLVEGDRAAIERQADEWRRKIAAEVGDGARVDIEAVESIPVLASGKRRFTLTKLQK